MSFKGRQVYNSPLLMRWPSKPKLSIILARVLNAAGCLSLFGFSWVYYFWCTRQPLPAPGEAVLVLGIIAALMALDMKNPLKAAGIVLIFTLAFLENKSIVQDRRNASTREVALWELAQKTASATTQTLTNVGLLGPQIADLNNQIGAADRNHDEKLVARLQMEKTKAQRQLLLAMVPGVSQEMSSLANRWWVESGSLTTQAAMEHSTDPAERHRQQQALESQRLSLTQKYTEHLQPLMVTADYLRQRLLENLPVDKRDVVEDQRQAAVFAKVIANQPFNSGEVVGCATYLLTLSKKVEVQ